MSKPIFKSNSDQVLRRSDNLIDMILGHMTMDIEMLIKTSGDIPVKTGAMKSEVRHFKTTAGKYRVEADKEYSAVQEAGIRLTGPGAPTQPFSHYTTAGTGPGWFRKAILNVVNRRPQYIDEARRALNL